MRKILIIGSAGSGKSTLATQLGAKLNLPVIHLDAHFWNPGWVETPKAEWRAKVAELCQGDRWVMDGNYSGTFDVRFAVADTILFLDVPRLVCLWRVLKRWVYYSLTSQTRSDLAAGCPEQIDWAFLQWIWQYPERSRPETLEMIEKHQEEKRVVVLRNDREAEEFLAGIKQKNEN